MYRAPPISNRLVYDKIFERQYKIHRNKITSLKLASPVPKIRFKSVQRNLRLKQIRKDAVNKIEKENTMLLEKIVDISTNSPKRSKSFVSYKNKPTLNGTKRKRELVHITQENIRMLQRLISQRSVYNLKKWEDDENERKKYVQFGSIYPYALDYKNNESFEKTSLPPINMKSKSALDTTLPHVMRKNLHMATIEESLQRKLKHPGRVINFVVTAYKIEGKPYNIQFSTLNKSNFISAYDILGNKTIVKEFDSNYCIF